MILSKRQKKSSLKFKKGDHVYYLYFNEPCAGVILKAEVKVGNGYTWDQIEYIIRRDVEFREKKDENRKDSVGEDYILLFDPKLLAEVMRLRRNIKKRYELISRDEERLKKLLPKRW
jgi:hypothetical protein